MIKICISVTSHALGPLPLSQTATPSRTPSPSSVTYFMDGPFVLRRVQHYVQTNHVTTHYNTFCFGHSLLYITSSFIQKSWTQQSEIEFSHCDTYNFPHQTYNFPSPNT